MQWKDLFYFSHGERRALSLLLFLIIIAWILLHFPDFKRKEITEKQSLPILQDTIKGNTFPQQSLVSSSPQPVSKKVVPAKTQKKVHEKSPRTYTRQEKFPPGTIIELNSADTTLLKKVPGIGSTFANRIIKYRDLLGGFYTVNQLSEVYGIDEERFYQLKEWFYTDTTHILKLDLNLQTEAELKKHPYINSRQAKTIISLRNRKGEIKWENIILLEEFSEVDKEKLKHYNHTPQPPKGGVGSVD